MGKSDIFVMVLNCLAPLIPGFIYVFKIRKYESNLFKFHALDYTCLDFVSSPAKSKITCQEDLECLKCKNCGAPLNKNLKCEYCDTQWFNKTD